MSLKSQFILSAVLAVLVGAVLVWWLLPRGCFGAGAEAEGMSAISH